MGIPRDLNIGNSHGFGGLIQGLLTRYLEHNRENSLRNDGISLCKEINLPWSFLHAWKILAARFLGFPVERKLDILELVCSKI